MIDVARLAGVSHQTVSRVVNGSDSVNPELADRVEQAIRQLRYRRNPAARALATSRSMSIGIVGFGLAEYGPSAALTGIADEGRRAGYATSIVSMVEADRANMSRALDHLVGESVDGIIVLAPVEGALTALEGVETDTPLVVFHPGAAPAVDRVATDEVAGARMATAHLVDTGHRTVHHVSGPQGWLGTSARIAGWTGELSERGLVAPPPLVGDWTTESGYVAGRALAADPRVTAVFAANDQMALGVMKALADEGVRVPGEVSVVGFDGVPESAYYRPGLTTIGFDFAEVGRRAVDQLLLRMTGQEPGPVPPVEPTFLLRESARADLQPRPEHRKQEPHV
ncbi:LacI family DNA-binding transcriptional regulator [Agromyces sp. GXQ0307]|uniref:LacI family DNA-binding transcriptional regulator n=1 Tax=Agromyces sp. GXQ0307 TaxID=3377835 RepID=UPI00383A720E